MSPKSSKKLEKKIAELEDALESEKMQSGKYLTQLKYAKADLENMQKQNQKRMDDIISRANGRLLLKLLPIVDEMELAVEASMTSNGKILDGVKMVKGKLEKLLESEGVKPIKATGEPFDPRYHEAVFEVDTEEHPHGSVIEIRKGYTYNNRVLRASMVKVARNHSSDEKDEKNE